jgi:hypothetical protein
LTTDADHNGTRFQRTRLDQEIDDRPVPKQVTLGVAVQVRVCSWAVCKNAAALTAPMLQNELICTHQLRRIQRP